MDRWDEDKPVPQSWKEESVGENKELIIIRSLPPHHQGGMDKDSCYWNCLTYLYYDVTAVSSSSMNSFIEES